MATFYADIDVINEEIKNAKTAMGQQMENLNSIQGEMSFMETAWEDQAQRVYSENFQGTKSRIEKFNSALEAYLNAFGEFVTEVENKDRIAGNTLRNISW